MTILLSLILTACDGEAPAEPAAPAAPAATPAAAPTPAPTPAPAPAPAANNSSNPNQLPGYSGTFAEDPALSPTDVAMWSEDYRVKRNEIFARYGRAFKSEDLQAHFGKTSWYKVNDSFAESMLTKNDNKNVALIQRFEGDEAKSKAQKNGEYHNGSDTSLIIVDAKNAELVDDQDDMYNWTREERYWVGVGGWIITWEGPQTWNPADGSIRNAQLWELDHGASTVVKIYELQRQQG